MSDGENRYPDPVTAVGLLAEKIGDKNDYIGIPFIKNINTVLAYLQTGYYHVHGEAFTYPLLANPVLLTAAAGAWNNTGAITEIIPAGIAVRGFDIHWAQVSDISDTMYAIIELFKGTAGNEVKITDFPIYRSAVFTNEGNLRIQIPQQSAGQRISGRLSTSIAGQGTCRIKVLGHYYG